MFCDATGVTKAHVFAKSYTSLFDDPNDTREHEVVHAYNDPVTGEKRELKRAKTFALISRKVCAGCNSGWLSELEERVRPVMAAFAANTPLKLDSGQQADLALWAVIAALIAMSMESDEYRFADPELAHEIYRERRPPAGMEIWLGGNTHGHMGWFGSHSLNIHSACAAADRRVGREHHVRLRRHPQWSSTASPTSGCGSAPRPTGPCAASRRRATASPGRRPCS